jgi:mannan endo-1,4-beta-mannosidase
MTPTDPMTPTQPPMTPADPMTPAQPTPGERLTVRGRHLYDRCGAKVVLRGVNEMVVWSQGRDGTPEFGEISKTGANSVRIVWNSTATAEELDRVLANAQLEKMIPMVEHHGPTGDITKVPDAVDYWTRVDVAAVLQKHTKSLLLNIANEAGDWNVADADFESTYRSAISKIRAAGIKVPLVIDASGWGQNVDQLLRSAPRLFAHDPLRNVLFSIHVYPRVGTSAADFDALTRRISNLDFPVVFGEFAITNPGTCQVRLDHRALITYSLAREISWYAWSWGGVKNTDCPRDFNMTTDGTFAGLVGWGLDVAVDHPASIENTSRRPRSVELGDCF